MKTAITLLIVFLVSFYTSGQQQFYVVIDGWNLEKLNASTCDSTFIGTLSFQVDDIAITSDYKLYGRSGLYLYQIDTSNANESLIGHLDSILFNATGLVADSAGNLLTVTFDSLYQIDRVTAQSFSRGYVGYNCNGDLAFYNDTLYFISSGRLIKVTLHPVVSAQLVGPLNMVNTLGINTICMNNAETMIISQGNLNHSNLYKVNPADASTTLLCDTIVHNLITGAASIYDVSGNGTEIMCSTLTGVLNTHAFNTEVVVFPNPASQLLTINWPSSFKGDMNIEVLNVLGEKVFSTLLWPVPISSGRGVGREAVDVSYLPNGVYFLKIDLEDRTVNKKFVVVHLEGGLLRAWQ